MKKYLWPLILVFGFIGCSGQPADKRTVVKINGYEITRQEFEREYKGSFLGRVDSVESRKEFLNSLINRQLVLQDAQKKGFDKGADFLAMIQRYWEQSLLKIALDRRSQEIVNTFNVSDKVVQATYQKMAEEGKADRPYKDMYPQIKWDIIRQRESQAMDDWLINLRKDSKIEINDSVLAK